MGHRLDTSLALELVFGLPQATNSLPIPAFLADFIPSNRNPSFSLMSLPLLLGPARSLAVLFTFPPSPSIPPFVHYSRWYKGSEGLMVGGMEDRREGDREWGVKMVLTGRERWEDLNSKKI